MPAKLGEIRHLLGHGLLHVVAGDAFVISSRLIVDQGAMGKVGKVATTTRPGRVPSGVPVWARQWVAIAAWKAGIASTVTGEPGI